MATALNNNMFLRDGCRVGFDLGGVLVRKIVITNRLILVFNLFKNFIIGFDLIEIFLIFHENPILKTNVVIYDT